MFRESGKKKIPVIPLAILLSQSGNASCIQLL